MHYHVVKDEYWMKEKDNIVETLGNFQNKILQPISQRESFIHSLQCEIRDLRAKRKKYSWFQCAFTKHDEVLAIDHKISDNEHLIRKSEYELKRAYEDMRQICYKMQHHWFDLVGVGYGDKKCRITEEEFAELDKRWAEAHPDEDLD